MAEYLIQDTTLEDIADAVRAKTGGSSAMTPSEMVTAIGNIPSGGGGIESYSGNIVLQNQDVYDLVIPVTVTGKTFFATAVCVETGIVENGQVITDDGYVMPHGSSDVVYAVQVFSSSLPYSLTYRYQENVADETVRCSNTVYSYGRYGRRTTIAGTTVETKGFVNIKVNPQNAGRTFCRSGLYLKFHYEVIAW